MSARGSAAITGPGGEARPASGAGTAPGARPRRHWRRLLAPRWLAWHAFAVCAAVGMLWLGRWQLHRAEAGNELSWAYTFEWPLFAILGVAFWVRTGLEELRAPHSAPASAASGRPAPAGTTGPEAANDHLTRLTAEVRRHGRWHGLR